MSYRDEVPSPVIEAAQVKFDLPITAILYLPEIEGFSLVGNNFNDSRAQFADWRLIRTSTVASFLNAQGTPSLRHCRGVVTRWSRRKALTSKRFWEAASLSFPAIERGQ